MQDLPIDPDKILTENDAEIIRHYCINDLDNTILIYNELLEQIELRKNMSFKYQRDLRSKSDAQIAESVIISEITKLRKYKPKKPMVDFNARLVYNKPSYIVFNSTLLNSIVTNICNSTFNLDINGSPILPAAIKDLKIRIGKTDYQLGFGGLHSKEKSISYVANDQYRIIDRDVESFYPRMILNQELYPQHLGTQFLDIFNEITETRVNAKRTKDTVTADSLKIVINGCFGKFGSSYSMVYSPNLMIQTTISGQLSLLMLIEAIENIGISVISANTDGIVIHCPRNRYDELNEIIKQWETKCSFKTEETEYIALYSRDINNYIAIKMDGAYKTKGAYLNPYNDKKLAIFRFHKNPETTICIEAVCNYLTGKSEIAHTIQSCQDIRKFVSIKNVKGGGQKNGVYLGKVIRWYYANNTHGEISYVGSGNKVSKTDGGKPLMDLPNKLPDDINYDWYISNCYDILEDIGFYHKPMIGD
jgi:hypothetical protein